MIPRSFKSSLKAFAANWGPLSKIILSGRLNHLYRLSSNSCATSLELIIFIHGHKITPFERPWLTMTRIESKLLDMGRSVIKSIMQLANGHVV